jgi:aerobic C4-dicarboxylate transport protein
MEYFKSLYIQVLVGITLGVICGWLFPSFAPTAKLISDTFINMIRMIIAPVIFCSIVTGIAGAGNMKKVGRLGIKALVYFEIVSSLALVIGLVVANVIRPGAGIQHSAVPSNQVAEIAKQAESFSWGDFISHIVPANVVDAFAKGDILQILFFSILFAVALKQLGSSGKSMIDGLNKINQVVFNILRFVMKLSPVGAFGGMAYTIGKFGFGTLFVLGKLMICFYLTGFLFIFLVLNGVCRYFGFSLWKLLMYIREEILIVLGASSSEAGLPSVMQKLEAAGCEKEVVGLIIPTGYSFNLDGTTIYLSMSVIFLAQVFNIDLSLGQQLMIIGILLITSKGAAGVTGSGFIVLASTLTAMKVIPLEGLALLIGVDRFMSEGRALINFIGNAIATVIISRSEKSIDEEKYQRVVGGLRHNAQVSGHNA